MDGFPEIQNIDSKEELYMALRGVDMHIPARSEGRGTLHAEKWVFAHLLATLGKYDQLDYPVTIKHSDKPDFLLGMPDINVGVEITEAIAKGYSEYLSYLEKKLPGEIAFPGLFRGGGARLSEEDILNIHESGERPCTLSTSAELEEEWAGFVRDVVKKKIERLAKPEFQKFRQNWLAIYDNTHLFPIELEMAVSFIRPLLKECWMSSPKFDAVFIESGSSIVRVTEASADFLHLNDIWQEQV